jgi:hypothetical protein
MVLFRESLTAWGKGKSGTTTTGVLCFLGRVTQCGFVMLICHAEVLSEQFVEEAVGILLTRFIPLSPTDLEKWMVDPEEWVNEEEKEGDAWEFELRVCPGSNLFAPSPKLILLESPAASVSS